MVFFFQADVTKGGWNARRSYGETTLQVNSKPPSDARPNIRTGDLEELDYAISHLIETYLDTRSVRVGL